MRHLAPLRVAAMLRTWVGYVLAVARRRAVGVARAARQAVHRDGRRLRVLVEDGIVTAGHLARVRRARPQEVDPDDRRVAAAAFRKMDHAVERMHAAAFAVVQKQFEFRVGRAGSDGVLDQVELVARDRRRRGGHGRELSWRQAWSTPACNEPSDRKPERCCYEFDETFNLVVTSQPEGFQGVWP